MIYNAYAEQNEEVLGIRLVSCGHIFSRPGREIRRPNGREDWLLFYVVKEEESFSLGAAPETAEAGSFILFAPGEKQQHVTLGERTAEFYFVHFRCEGTLPATLLTSKLYHAPPSREVCDLFEKMLDETLRKKPLYEKRCLYQFLDILTLLEREILFGSRPDRENFERIALVVQDMNKNYAAGTTLEEYAELCGMSKYHFLRTFEAIVGCPPMEYRTNVRMQHAADLLSEEGQSVERIADLLGYSSACYFSTVFKKKYGTSPRAYRQSVTENKTAPLA